MIHIHVFAGVAVLAAAVSQGNQQNKVVDSELGNSGFLGGNLNSINSQVKGQRSHAYLMSLVHRIVTVASGKLVSAITRYIYRFRVFIFRFRYI